MEQKDERYRKLKEKASLLLAANKYSVQLIVQLKSDFRATFLGLVSIFLGTPKTGEIDRIASLGHRIERIYLMLTDFACYRDKNYRNFLDTNSKAVQTDRVALERYSLPQTLETSSYTIYADSKLVEQVSSYIEQLSSFFEYFERTVDYRYNQLHQRLLALEQQCYQVESARSHGVGVLLEIRRNVVEHVENLVSTGPLNALLALRNRIYHLDTVFLAAKSQVPAVERQAKSAFNWLDAASRIDVLKDSITALCFYETENYLVKLSAVYERLISGEKRLDYFNEQFMSSSRKARVVEQQRDECVEELTALCTAVRGYKDREEQMKQKYEEKMMAQSQEILYMQAHIVEAEEELRGYQQLLAEAAGLLECDKSSIIATIYRLHASISQLRLKIQRPKDETMANGASTHENGKPLQDARTIADFERRTQDAQMQAATLTAQLRTCEQELRMALDALQFYETQYNRANLFLNDRGISVVNSDLVSALSIFYHNLLANAAAKVLEESSQIRKKLFALRKAVLQGKKRQESEFQRAIDAIEDKVLVLVLGYEQQLKSGHLALQQEKKCSVALVDALMRMSGLVESIDLEKTDLIWRRVCSLRSRLESTQIAFIALSRAAVEVSAVNRYSGRRSAPQ